MTDFTEFAKPLEAYVEDFTARQDTSAAQVGDVNFPVHDQRLGLPEDYPNHQKVPRSIYFYYLSLNSNGGLDVRHYFYPGGDHTSTTNPVNPNDWPDIPNTDEALVPILKNLIANARAKGNAYPLLGSGLQGIEWYRKSYFVLFIDEETWSLHQDSATGQSAVLFVTNQQEGKYGTPNHSFFDGRNLTVRMPGEEPRSGFVCINHMKRDAAGEDLRTNDKQVYVFKLFFNVEFVTGETPLTVIFDPDGTNLGPPLGPP
jgi:hypothetical protein